jgi:hypothetical protein
LVVIGCELQRGTSHLWCQEESPRSRPLIAHHAARFSTGLHAHALLSDSGVVQMMETMQPNRPLSLCSELDLEISSRLQYSIDELYHLSADMAHVCPPKWNWGIPRSLRPTSISHSNDIKQEQLLYEYNSCH